MDNKMINHISYTIFESVSMIVADALICTLFPKGWSRIILEIVSGYSVLSVGEMLRHKIVDEDDI